MLWFILAITSLLLLDFLRSFFIFRKMRKEFYHAYKNKIHQPVQTFGSGKPFHFAIIGDSTFDTHGDTKVLFGPAQVMIDTLAKHNQVSVHPFAKAGAKSYDVIREQLPLLKKI